MVAGKESRSTLIKKSYRNLFMPTTNYADYPEFEPWREMWDAIITFLSSPSVAMIATGYKLDDRSSSIRFPARARNFSLLHRGQTGCGFQPVSYPVGSGGSFPGVKRPGREADHSPPSSAEVKNAWRYTSTPWRGAYLSKGTTLPLLLPYHHHYEVKLSSSDVSV
jgi:hypothetical protein